MAIRLIDPPQRAPDGEEVPYEVDEWRQMLVNYLRGILISATTSVSGLVELATSAETNTGTDATLAVTPVGLTAWTGDTAVVTVGTLATGDATAIVSAATTSLAGKVELATSAETNTGTDATLAVTPVGLTAWTGDTAVVTVGTLATGDATAIVSAATTSLAGKVELATIAETDGASAVLAVTPEGLNQWSGWQLGASVYSTSATTLTNVDTYYIIDFNEEAWDLGSNFASDRYTVGTGEAGRYRVSGLLTFSGLTDLDNISAAIKINGAIKAFTVAGTSGTGWHTSSLNKVFNLADADYIEMFAKNIDTAGSVIQATYSGSYMDIEYLGT